MLNQVPETRLAHTASFKVHALWRAHDVLRVRPASRENSDLTVAVWHRRSVHDEIALVFPMQQHLNGSVLKKGKNKQISTNNGRLPVKVHAKPLGSGFRHLTMYQSVRSVITHLITLRVSRIVDILGGENGLSVGGEPKTLICELRRSSSSNATRDARRCDSSVKCSMLSS